MSLHPVARLLPYAKRTHSFTYLMSPKGSEYPIFGVSDSESHTAHGIRDQRAQILGTWTLWVIQAIRCLSAVYKCCLRHRRLGVSCWKGAQPPASQCMEAAPNSSTPQASRQKRSTSVAAQHARARALA